MKQLFSRSLILIYGFLCCLPTVEAQSFAKAYKRYYLKQNYEAATPVFQRYRHHPKLGPAAIFLIDKMALRSERSLSGLLLLNNDLIRANSAWRTLSRRNRKRLLRKYGVDTLAMADLRMQAQGWAMAGVRSSGSIAALDSLLADWKHPIPSLQTELDSTHYQVVNAQLRSVDYQTMTAIVHRHLGWVYPANYRLSRQMYNQLWPAFQQQYTLCEWNKYVKDHPSSFVARDCWQEEVRQLLCRRELAPMLDFESNNQWTVMETVLLNAIFSLEDQDAAIGLTPAQYAVLQDLRQRATLREQLRTGKARRDTTAMLENALYYISRYAPRYSAFRLLEETLQFCTVEELYGSATRLLTDARPYFPDTLPKGCASNFDYQVRAKPFIDGLLPIFQKHDPEIKETYLETINTEGHDETNPVLDTAQTVLYFASSRRADNQAGMDVFCSRKGTAGWSSPECIESLSCPGDQIPLSLTADGKTMLLQSNGALYLSRQKSGVWSAPVPIALSGLGLIGKAVLSADGATMILEGAYTAGGVLDAPDMDLFISRRAADGHWSEPQGLGSDINTDGNEGNPFLSADGRKLYFTSTEYPGLGQSDVFVSERHGNDWILDWSRPLNMGKHINGIHSHNGFGHVSPDGKRMFFARYGRDQEKANIWMLEIEN